MWTMFLKHPRLNGGLVVGSRFDAYSVPGQGLSYHRDYFDAGAMLYEQLLWSAGRHESSRVESKR